MKLRYLFALNAVVSLIFAAGLLLASKTILGLFRLTVGSTVAANTSMNYVAQLLGASMILVGLISWFAGSMGEVGARRSSAISLFVFHVVALPFHCWECFPRQCQPQVGFWFWCSWCLPLDMPTSCL